MRVIKYSVASLRASYHTLAGKLIIATGVILFGGSLVFGHQFFRYNERLMMDNLEIHSLSSANLVKRAIHDGMLAANYDITQQTVEALAVQEEILNIRVIDTEGKVAFSSEASEVGGSIKKTPALSAASRGREPEPYTYAGTDGAKVLTFNLPINNEPACFNAQCHVHSPGKAVLGVLQTSFSTSAIETTRSQMVTGTLIIGIVFVLSISLVLMLIFHVFVTKPVKILKDGMQRLARGDLDTPIEIRSQDEMGVLAEAFNAMADDVRAYRKKMEGWTQTLQDEVDKKASEILNAHEQIINAEKLASLGRMAAGVAHELNSPLTGVMTFAHLLKSRIPPDRKEDMEDIDVIIEQTERCSKIIKGMLGFARKGVSETNTIEINQLVESVIAMVRNQAKFHNIQLRVELKDGLPRITVDPLQVQQVFLNLLTNAADAMNDRGAITVVTRVHSEGPEPEEQFVEVEFTDTGPGIMPDLLGRIFEPFYTTKPAGKGTGLGLPVSYGIIKRHGGDIVVRSSIGKGTSFFIRLPFVPPKAIAQKQETKGDKG